MESNYKDKYDILNSVLEFVNTSFTNEMELNELFSELNSKSCMLTKSKISAFFVLDDTTFEFKLAGKYSTVKTLKVTEAFEFFVDKGIIAEVLGSEEKTTIQISNNEVACILPIKNKNMISFLQLLIMDSSNLLVAEQVNVLYKLSSIIVAKYYEKTKKVILPTRTTNIEDNLINQIENLKRGKEELHKIIDSLHEGILIVDKTTNKIKDCNQSALNLISTAKEYLLEKNKDEYFLFFDSLIFKDEIISDEEAILVNKDGKTIPIIYKVNDVIIGDYEYQIVSFLDITERKLMEDKIQQSRFELEFMVEDRTRELLNTNKELEEQIVEREKAQNENLKLVAAIQQTPSLVLITGIDGKIQYANQALCKKSGYELNELLGKTPRIFKSGDLSRSDYEFMWRVLTSGETYKNEFRNKNKNGELYWVSVNISSIKNDFGKIINYLSVQEDITIRKKDELELILAKEKIEKAEKAKSSLLANMSHEFRTPLISILGFSELLESELANEDLKEMINAIQSGGKRLLNSLESVLALSHLESSDLTFNMKEVNLIPIINNAINILIPEARKKNLSITFESSLEEINVSTEESYLTQTINHLIDNAIKFTNQGEVRITLDYVIDKEKDYIQINIADTGIGIAEEEQQIIFEAFRQASEGYNRNYEGFGLGLTIAQKTIQLMAGKITVKSTPKVGSIFTIWIPFSSIK